jgi:hypothetical protein
MALTPDQLIYQLEIATRINKQLAQQNGKILVATDPVTYNKQYLTKLQALKNDGEKFVKDQLQIYANSGLPQANINEAVGQKALEKYRISLSLLNQQFPFKDAAAQQILQNSAPGLARRRAAPRSTVAKKRTKKRTTKKAKK